MGMNYLIVTTILVFFITSHVSNAEISWNFRKLAAASPNQDPNVTVSPSPSPFDVDDKSKDIKKPSSPPLLPEDKNLKDEQVNNVTVRAPVPVPVLPSSDGTEHSDSPKEEVKGGKGDDSSKDGDKHDEKPKEEVKGGKKDDSNKDGEKHDEKPKDDLKETEKGVEKPVESCNGMEKRCQDEKSLVACIKSFDDASKTLVLLVQNQGDSKLRVKYTFSPGIKQDLVEIPKLQTQQVNISVADVSVDEIKLNAGNGYCVLNRNVGISVSEGNYFQWYPSYSKFMTPMYGAYLVLGITLIAGGVCACCWFTKRKRHSDVPYQELEMSMPESAAAAAAETAEGWDEVWDDDWDEEKAVKSPGHAISANGLTSRAPKKDDWEDWDD